MQELTAREGAVLEVVRRSIDEGMVPSVREIGDQLRIKSTSTVHGALKSLEKKGYLLHEGNRNRAIRLPGKAVTRVPLLGNIAAGLPILAEEMIEEYIPIPCEGNAKELFALRVRGESMIKIGILDGDLIIVRRCQTAEDGDVVVALIDDEATVKRFYREDGGYRLQPENDEMEPIYTDHLLILGHVTALYRDY